MRKEELLSRKNSAKGELTWYVRDTVTEEELKQFSLAQIKTLCDIMRRAEQLRESAAPFYILSCNEVLQKSSGKIACFEDSGEIREETEEEVMHRASRSIYEAYKTGKSY